MSLARGSVDGQKRNLSLKEINGFMLMWLINVSFLQQVLYYYNAPVVIKPVFHKARSSLLQTWHAPAYLWEPLNKSQFPDLTNAKQVFIFMFDIFLRHTLNFPCWN